MNALCNNVLSAQSEYQEETDSAVSEELAIERKQDYIWDSIQSFYLCQTLNPI